MPSQHPMPGPVDIDISTEDVTPCPRPRALSIDDDPAVLRATDRCLRARFAVTATTSALEAIGMLESGFRFDVIVCDLWMPGTDGAAFFERVEQLSPTQAARILFVSGGGPPEEARAVRSEQAHAAQARATRRSLVGGRPHLHPLRCSVRRSPCAVARLGQDAHWHRRPESSRTGFHDAVTHSPPIPVELRHRRDRRRRPRVEVGQSRLRNVPSARSSSAPRRSRSLAIVPTTEPPQPAHVAS